jgi:hypothetical protein
MRSLIAAGNSVASPRIHHNQVCVSSRLTVEIGWDGEWQEGAAELEKHLRVKEVGRDG